MKEEYPIEEELEEAYKEIERLNKIINELEKWAKEYLQDMEFRCYMNMMIDKLRELKGSDKE